MIPENTLTEKAKNVLNIIKQIEKTVDRENLVYRTNEYKYSFKTFRTITTFGRDNYNSTITLKEVDKDQSSLLVEIMKFKSKMKPRNPEKNQKKKDILKNLYTLFHGRERVLDAFESGIFPIKFEGTVFSDLGRVGKASDHTQDKVFDHSNLKILTLKQMLQRLPITLAQVETGNTSKNSLKEIGQIIYSLYRAKEITKKVYNNIMNSIKVKYKNAYYIYEF